MKTREEWEDMVAEYLDHHEELKEIDNSRNKILLSLCEIETKIFNSLHEEEIFTRFNEAEQDYISIHNMIMFVKKFITKEKKKDYIGDE